MTVWHSPGFSVRYFSRREGLGQDQREGEGAIDLSTGSYIASLAGEGVQGDVTRVERVDRVEEVGNGQWTWTPNPQQARPKIPSRNITRWHQLEKVKSEFF
jgi:hypothetical protein